MTEPFALPNLGPLTQTTGLAYALTSLNLSTFRAGIILPLQFLLFYASSAPQRRTVSFVLCVICSVMLEIEPLMLWGASRPILVDSGAQVNKGKEFASMFMTLTVPWIADLVITLRLLLLYPPRSTSRRKLLAVFTLPVLIKAARLVAMAFELKSFWKELQDVNIGSFPGLTHGATLMAMLEYGGQVVDSTYSSALCIYKLAPLIWSKSATQRPSARLRRALQATLTSFVFPSCASIALVVTAALSSPENYEAVSWSIIINSGVVTINILVSSILLMQRSRARMEATCYSSGAVRRCLHSSEMAGQERDFKTEGYLTWLRGEELLYSSMPEDVKVTTPPYLTRTFPGAAVDPGQAELGKVERRSEDPDVIRPARAKARPATFACASMFR